MFPINWIITVRRSVLILGITLLNSKKIFKLFKDYIKLLHFKQKRGYRTK